jgi:fucose 4-O-acetylase-like acetyltransferase
VTATLDRSPAPGLPADRARRDPRLDNAKLALVMLVVVGHSWTMLPETELNNRLYDWLYLWHVPAFVMVTGYLSRSFGYSRRHLRRLMTTVALPYLAFEGLLALFRVHVGGEDLERLWLNPHWPMWYLSVLFLWRLVTPALRRLPYAVPLTVAVSLLGGLVAAEPLDVNRALGLLPFFTIGLLAEERQVDLLRRRATRLGGVVVLAAGAWFAAFVDDRLATEWLYYRTPFAELDVGWLQGVATRGLLVTVGLLMTLSALAWVPRRGGWFSRLGSASLVVYLFHGFFVKGAEYAGFEGWASDRPVLSLVLVTLTSVVVTLGLSWRPVHRPLQKLVTPDP